MIPKETLTAVDFYSFDELNKVIFLSFYLQATSGKEQFTLAEVSDWFEELSLPAFNRTRLRNRIRKSRLFSSGSIPATFRLHPKSTLELEAKYASVLSIPKVKKIGPSYVDPARIAALRGKSTSTFDLSRLCLMCEELNVSHRYGSCHAIIMLTRAILDHVPPIFGFRTFGEVASSYSGGKSLKDSMKNLENSSRKIADQYLHGQIRKKESVPTLTQVDFSNDLDVLLSEIVRIA